jgi:hypothetical protein
MADKVKFSGKARLMTASVRTKFRARGGDTSFDFGHNAPRGGGGRKANPYFSNYKGNR